jgi:hypothetical protein
VEETKGLIKIHLREAFPIGWIEDLQEGLSLYTGSSDTEGSLGAIMSSGALLAQGGLQFAH